MDSQPIASGDLEATTLTKGIDADLRLEAGMVFLESGDFTILPFASLTANGDTHRDYGWDNYLRSGGGLRLQKGPFFLFVEGGYQTSFNSGNAGLYLYGGASMYLSINK